jgi:predicted nucleic acid-binding protein
VVILDTNVISALMTAPREESVARWLDQQPAPSIWITSITLFEIRTGLGLLPTGRKRLALEAAFDTLLSNVLKRRLLDFDGPAAIAAAEITARRRAAGVNVDIGDTQIAGIAAARRATLATRNVRHFEDMDIPVVNPWA